uniref:Uncharacterized protein n=1 Tax=Branchiostoma floridae TaxID=7739 RepID=C3ZRI6_BRAFL|eukprot:XP_002588775.1 hypothetical protein BRAFLDRAFT_89796 [Branchiostoma floridae]
MTGKLLLSLLVTFAVIHGTIGASLSKESKDQSPFIEEKDAKSFIENHPSRFRRAALEGPIGALKEAVREGFEFVSEIGELVNAHVVWVNDNFIDKDKDGVRDDATADAGDLDAIREQLANALG